MEQIENETVALSIEFRRREKVSRNQMRVLAAGPVGTPPRVFQLVCDPALLTFDSSHYDAFLPSLLRLRSGICFLSINFVGDNVCHNVKSLNTLQGID